MPTKLHVLFYEYVDDALERRQPVRPAHLELIERYHADGRLTMAGAYGDPPHGGLLVFRDAADAEAFAHADPYAEAGVVARWRVEPWTVVTPE